MATHHYNKPNPRRSSRHDREPIEVQVVMSLLKGIWWLVSWPFRSSGTKSPARRRAQALDVHEIGQRWSEIQTKIGLGGTSHYASAIVSADKLLDHVLRLKGYAGETMGERLKSARDDVSPAIYHNAWQAHKLRNQLVHEVGTEVMSYQAKEAIQQYEAILRDLGAIR